jgi:hypothetical protein
MAKGLTILFNASAPIRPTIPTERHPFNAGVEAIVLAIVATIAGI